MRKSLAIFLLILIPVFNIHSADQSISSSDTDLNSILDHSSATFEILGYKVNPSADLAFEITDALSESLAVINSEDSIELDSHIDQLLGSLSSPASDPRNQIIFSYRVTGRGNENSSNTYRVVFEFKPFYRYVDGSKDEANWLNASYQLVNLSYSFPDYTSDSYNNQGSIGSIKKHDDTNENLTIVKNDTEATITSKWTVEGVYAPLWIHRGAVTLTIDNSTAEGGYNYPSAAFGQYKAAVTATLYSP